MTDENLHDANAALRELRGLYWELGEAQGIEYGFLMRGFDPLTYVDAVPATLHLQALDLLQEGSGVALVCELMDWFVGYDEESGIAEVDPRLNDIREALASGRFDGIPEVRSAVVAAFARGYDGLLEHIGLVYVRLVLPRLKGLAEGAVSGRMNKQLRTGVFSTAE